MTLEEAKKVYKEGRPINSFILESLKLRGEKMDLRPYFGKNVIVTDVDNIIYKGFVAVGTIPGDSDDNCYEIDLIGTKQYGDSYFTLTEYEIKSIELDPDKEDLRKSE